jgi:hypothetical protein
MAEWRTAAGVLALVGGAAAELAQFVVAPGHISGGSAADQVAAVAGHPGRMQTGLWLDLPVLLILPAILYLGRVAGAPRSRFASTGMVVAFVGALGMGYLLAADVLVYQASVAPDPAAATDLLAAYESYGVVTVATVLAVVGTTVGFVLLGIALIRTRPVPLWAGVAVTVAPVASLVGEASGMEVIAAAAYALQLAGFAACAVAVTRRDRVPAPDGVTAAVA